MKSKVSVTTRREEIQMIDVAQAQQVFNYWQKQHPEVLATEKNAATLAEWVFQFYGTVTVVALDAAYAALKDKLDLAKTLTQEQRLAQEAERALAREASENRRRQADQKANDANVFMERAKAADKKLVEAHEAKLQDKAQKDLNTLILQSEVYAGPNRIDQAKTASLQRDLRAIKVMRNGVVDNVLTLKAVSAALANRDYLDSPIR
jgi:hypothetical protein